MGNFQHPYRQQKEKAMARRTLLVSDLSGEEISEGKGATVTISFRDARKGTIVLDLTDSEAEQMGAKGRRQAKRGRRSKYLSPGMYVEEISSGSRPIEGVGTSVAAFVGTSPRQRKGARGQRSSPGRG
jgi:hypothetical protein